MATTIIIKNSNTSAATPTAGQLSVGELAVNTADRKIYTKHSDGTVVTVGGGASGAAGNEIFYENGKTVTANYTITTNKNAMSVGPITVNSGVTVTIPSGSRWVVL